MNLRIDNTSEEMTVWLTGELDHHIARLMREQIDSAIERSKPTHLYLDFSDVGFMDSSGIGLIMGRYRLMKLYNGDMKVTGASERIKKVMRLAGLDCLNVLKSEDSSENV